MQPIDSIETYAHGTSKDLLYKKEEIKCNKAIQKKLNFDYITKKNMKKHNLNWPEIPDHLYKILIVGGSGFGKTNTLLNLINHETDTDKIYSYAEDSYEAKYQLLINKREII